MVQKRLKSGSEASERSACQYPVNYTDGIGALLPHLSKIKTSSQLLGLKAMALSLEKDSRPCLEALDDHLSLIHSLDAEPIAISQLVKLACIGQLGVTLEFIFNQRHLTPQDAALLVPKWIQLENTQPCFKALEFELINVLDCIRRPKLLAQMQALMKVAPSRIMQKASIGKDILQLQAQNELAKRQLKNLYPLDRQLQIQFDQSFQDAKAKNLVMTSLYGGTVLSNIPKKVVRGTCMMRLAVLALECQEHARLKGGVYPASLSEIHARWVPDLPRDPFTGNAFHLKKQKNGGILIYSFGADHIDNKGSRVKDSKGNMDLVMELSPLP